MSGDAILIASGCVCCALRGDLVETLRGAAARRDSGAMPPFARIILETTGLTEPAPILNALFADLEVEKRLALAGVTTLVDAGNGLATLRAWPGGARQIALADPIAFAKSDLLPFPGRGSRAVRRRFRAGARGARTRGPKLRLSHRGAGRTEGVWAVPVACRRHARAKGLFALATGRAPRSSSTAPAMFFTRPGRSSDGPTPSRH